MRLALPSLILFLYILFSLIIWLPCRPWVKIAMAITFFLIGLKYVIYVYLGGSFISPGFPFWALVLMEFFYSAMIMLVFLLIIKDLLALFFFISRLFGSSWHLPLAIGIRSLILIVMALALSGYATWESMRVPKVKTVNIALAGLPAELDGFSIVQLTDLHVGPLLHGKWLEQVVNKTNALKTDLIVLTGDLIDGTPVALKNDIAPYGKLHARYGVYGVTGNHEYYFGAMRWEAVFANLGIEMLDNEYRAISVNGKNLILTGVPDEAALRFGEKGPVYTMLQNMTQKETVILLQHRPSRLTSDSPVDLQLSGHTHGGHIFFLKWLIAAFNDGLVSGLVDFNGPKLYISSGTGLWSGFSCRLGVPPEITQLILRRQEG